MIILHKFLEVQLRFQQENTLNINSKSIFPKISNLQDLRVPHKVWACSLEQHSHGCALGTHECMHICGHVYIWMCIHLETQSLQLVFSPITLTFTYLGRVSHCTQSSWILDTFISQFALGDIFPISSP